MIPIQVFEGENFDARHVEPVPAAFAGKLPFFKRLDTEELRLVEMLFSALRKRQGVGLELLDTLLNHWLEEKPPGNLRVLHREKDASLALKNYLESAYADTGGYRDFCAIAGLSPSHLCRSFKKAYRMTPTQYLIQLRLTHARRLIAAGLPVAQAAREVGIRDASYFARVFRKSLRLRPSQVLETKD
ncbi:helix-turn-helix transcriptional regulator [Oscillatoria laete-virens NRMC-F 0139]|nr:helix-turn-helix transcriptional regulator [Oscillatoria laete-virens]MDL5054446.1 helix-turn-helix transcriptional regulator [Oscillatoria laete-virens NRMC-F 0139]